LLRYLLQLEAVQPADPPQRLVDLGALDLELALIREHLPGNAGVVRNRGDPLGAGVEHLERARVRVVALALVHDGSHAIARNRTGDEHHVSTVTQPGDALAAERERLDLKFELIAALGTRLGAGRRVGAGGRRVIGRGVGGRDRVGAHSGPTSSSSRAFCAWRRFSA
jgi:hypothetical protein